MTEEIGSFAGFLNRWIEQAYEAGGYKMGWRLLYSPEDTLRGARVAFLAMNPGFNRELEDHAEFAMDPRESAYVHEAWPKPRSDGSDRYAPGEAPFQKQVRALFHRVGEKEPHRVLAGNLVPFRAPSWSDIEDKSSALEFGKELWQEIIERARPSIVIAMGAATKEPLIDILGIDRDSLEKIEIPWGDIDLAAYRGEFPGGIFIHMPHLSRFAIMISPNYESERQQIFRGLAK
jgi:hypothetical protein